MKKILFLGGAATQLPPIRYALEKGYYVITCDYLPNNPGHELAHEYYNVSTTDKKTVLELAKRLKIDAIVAYASDPAAPTAAYVSDILGLAGNPPHSVEVLARKDKFREFLENNGFNTPQSKSFYSIQDAELWLNEIGLPAFVKPIDSSGSKGVTNLIEFDRFNYAFEHALHFSREKKVVVEEKIERVGYQVDSDIFMYGGEIVFWAWGNQHQDINCHKYAPVAISFPSVLPEEVQNKAKNEIEKILKKLNFKSGAFNVEFVVDRDNNIWVIEIGPRNGGNLIPQVMKYSYGVDMIAATVEVALGNPPLISLDKSCQNGFWSSYIVHSRENGIFKGLQLSEKAKSYIVECNMLVEPGDYVSKFNGSHDTLGTMILKYPNMDSMLNMIDRMEEDIAVLVE